MLRLVRTNQFKRDYKLARKRGYSLRKLAEVVTLIASGESLPPKHRDHGLLGEYSDCRECHIQPDWLLIYRTRRDELSLIRTGTHADLFE
ncbi:MAG TPA: type II toxin-antitoxin system YafQ family toxin [Bacteroidota bacterium]|nr:type II toxin-antitoxin system YafQ family toxin [Bacteroidota bacterium]